jgi:hypothetical protein
MKVKVVAIQLKVANFEEGGGLRLKGSNMKKIIIQRGTKKNQDQGIKQGRIQSPRSRIRK